MSNNPFSRRKFLAGAAVVGAAGSMGVGTLASCAGVVQNRAQPELTTGFQKSINFRRCLKKHRKELN